MDSHEVGRFFVEKYGTVFRVNDVKVTRSGIYHIETNHELYLLKFDAGKLWIADECGSYGVVTCATMKSYVSDRLDNYCERLRGNYLEMVELSSAVHLSVFKNEVDMHSTQIEINKSCK